MKKHKIVDGYFRISTDDYYHVEQGDLAKCDWPGITFEKHPTYKMMDGLRVLPFDFARKIASLGYWAVLVIWPNTWTKKPTDSYVSVTNRMTFIFAKKGQEICFSPWNAWNKKIPVPEIDFGMKRYKLVEVHEFNQPEYFGPYFRTGWSPMPVDADVSNYNEMSISMKKGRYYFGRYNRAILKFLKKPLWPE